MRTVAPFFSIIMPVYNSEEYLSTAIESVLNQTYQDFELILVEDCSVDGSYVICQRYKESDSRIRLFHSDINRGVVNARNIGVRVACGEYVTFIDSDDYVELTLLQTLRDAIYQHPSIDVDIIKYSLVEEYYNEKMKLTGTKTFGVEDQLVLGHEKVKGCILDLWHRTIFAYLWSTVYKRKSLRVNEWVFDDNFTIGEDAAMNIEVYSKATNLLCLSYIGYHYGKRQGDSLSTAVSPDVYYMNYARLLKNILQKYKEWGLFDEYNRGVFSWLYIKAVYQVVERCIGIKDTNRAYGILDQQVFQDSLFYEFRRMRLESISVKRRLMGFFVREKHKRGIILLSYLIHLLKTNFRVVFAYAKE